MQPRRLTEMVLCISLMPLSLCFAGEVQQETKLTFEKDIRPILKAHCFHCHGEGGIKEGSLDLRLRRWIVAGGESGQAIDPGDAEHSLMLQRVKDGDMPPGDKTLSQIEVDTLTRWVALGAPTARTEPETLDDPDYITEEERGYWSFQPIIRHQPPRFADADVLHPIDAFVRRRLREKGLDFSIEADRYTLIRRATFDLWGLPPSPEMVEAFIQDQSPNAYAKLIDRLLASGRYGERWGRHWLDVAGYADSEGYSTEDTQREFAYFYRDYVIDSFNANKPIDQFVREQLAGDEMGEDAANGPLDQQRITRLTATGFLRMAPDGTATGGVDRAVAANQTIADTIEIVSSSLLGLTVGCARCHDHRYDPISQADYYRFRAIFEPALDWKKWQLPRQRRISLYTDEDRKQREAIERQAKEAEAARTERQQQHIDRTLYEELLVVPDDKREALKSAFKTEKAKRSTEQTALLEEYPSIGNISPGSLYLYAEQRARRAGDIEKAAAKREARYILEAKEAHPQAEVTAESLKELLPQRYAEIQAYRQAAKTCREQDAKTELANMQKAVKAIRDTAPKENFLRALKEPPGNVPPTRLFIRGDHNQPDQPLPPNELTVLRRYAESDLPANDPGRPTTGRRLAYARHLTSGKHPLLARVLMNRVWLHHFGRGIVDSPGDFGNLGATPTHPQLLDWLADELMRVGWDLKRMHRMIMLSQTYRQVSDRTEHLDRIDPDNRLYARMSVRRLETEAIRDSVLAACGRLVSTLNGPPVPVKEDAVGQIVLGVEMLDGERKPSGKQEDFEGASRRSVYVQVRRSRPLAVLETFDMATNSPNCAARSYSNVATQALMMMNSQFVIEHADRLAQFLMKTETELPQQLSLAWKRCFASEIDNSLLVEMIDFVKEQKTEFQSRDSKLTPQAAHQLALASACQAMFSCNEFIYID